MGTVMEFNDGEDRRVLVLDAQYRVNRRFGTYQYDSPLMNYGNETRYLNMYENSDTTTLSATSVTDDWINTNICKDTNTAKQNCDIWMTLTNYVDSTPSKCVGSITGVPAVAYCRSIFVDGRPCDLPNIQTLARIYCDAEAIDSMDPTISEYSKYALGSRNPQGAWSMGTQGSGSGGNTHCSWLLYSWSSTEGSNTHCWGVQFNGRVDPTGPKYSEYPIIPVLEL